MHTSWANTVNWALPSAAWMPQLVGRAHRRGLVAVGAPEVDVGDAARAMSASTSVVSAGISDRGRRRPPPRWWAGTAGRLDGVVDRSRLPTSWVTSTSYAVAHEVEGDLGVARRRVVGRALGWARSSGASSAVMTCGSAVVGQPARRRGQRPPTTSATTRLTAPPPRRSSAAPPRTGPLGAVGPGPPPTPGRRAGARARPPGARPRPTPSPRPAGRRPAAPVEAVEDRVAVLHRHARPRSSTASCTPPLDGRAGSPRWRRRRTWRRCRAGWRSTRASRRLSAWTTTPARSASSSIGHVAVPGQVDGLEQELGEPDVVEVEARRRRRRTGRSPAGPRRAGGSGRSPR